MSDAEIMTIAVVAALFFAGYYVVISKTIHAVTAAGFELKLVLFLLAYSVDCLVG